jgi:hypothetical protein
MKLGIVLARRADLALARALTAAALRAGDEVRWFAMDEGVEALAVEADDVEDADDLVEPSPPTSNPLPEAVEVFACATSVDQRALAMPLAVTLGSQDDHAALLAWADRTVALT